MKKVSEEYNGEQIEDTIIAVNFKTQQIALCFIANCRLVDSQSTSYTKTNFAVYSAEKYTIIKCHHGNLSAGLCFMSQSTSTSTKTSLL